MKEGARSRRCVNCFWQRVMPAFEKYICGKFPAEKKLPTAFAARAYLLPVKFRGLEEGADRRSRLGAKARLPKLIPRNFACVKF